MVRELGVLLVENVASESLLLQKSLEAESCFHFEVTNVARLDEALSILRSRLFDVVLLDLNLPDSAGRDTFARLHGEVRSIPVVILCDAAEESTAVDALEQGAQDYLIKGRMEQSLVARSIRYAVEQKASEQALSTARAGLDLAIRERMTELSRTMDALKTELSRQSAAALTLRERAERLQAMAARAVFAEQRERKRLARLLHDDLQHLIVGAKYHLAAVNQPGVEGMGTALKGLETILDESVIACRALAAELDPPILQQPGLLRSLEWLCRSMEEKHGLALKLIAKGEIRLREDLRILLFEAVRELLANVVMHSGASEAEVSLTRRNGELELTVSDRGAGFDTARLKAGKASESGLGLDDLQDRMSLIGGRMEVSSAPGRGTTVKLILPEKVLEPSAPNGAKPTDSPGAVTERDAARRGSGYSKIRILLVDDHEVIRHGLRLLLQNEPDLEVVAEASSGREALELVRRHQPQIVLMDVSMPDLDGIDATRILHEEFPSVKVIGLSMFAENEFAARMRAAGAVNYLSKSGPSGEVLEAVRSCAESGTPGPASPATTRRGRPTSSFCV